MIVPININISARLKETFWMQLFVVFVILKRKISIAELQNIKSIVFEIPPEQISEYDVDIFLFCVYFSILNILTVIKYIKIILIININIFVYLNVSRILNANPLFFI